MLTLPCFSTTMWTLSLQLHRQNDLISSVTPLMRGQKKVIKRRSPTGHTSDSSTSLHRGMKVYTLPPEMSGVSPEEGLSSSKLAQITRNARMLFSQPQRAAA